MESKAVIFNDEAKCLHVAIDGTRKFAMMGHINCEDHVSIKRWWTCKKMNAKGKMFKDNKKQGNHQKRF